MLVGIGLIGTVSATVAAWFVKHHPREGKDSTPEPGTPAPPENLEAAVADLTAQVRELTAQQAELQRSIDRLTTTRIVLRPGVIGRPLDDAGPAQIS